LTATMTATSMANPPGEQLHRLCLPVLALAFMLVWTVPGEANSPGAQQTAGGSTTVAGAATSNGNAVAESAAAATDAAVSRPDDQGAAGPAGKGGGKDLTVFFSIGVIVDILLVTAFLIWAVGQWTKSKKQE